MANYVRKAVVFVCVFSLGCSHLSAPLEEDVAAAEPVEISEEETGPEASCGDGAGDVECAEEAPVLTEASEGAGDSTARDTEIVAVDPDSPDTVEDSPSEIPVAVDFPAEESAGNLPDPPIAVPLTEMAVGSASTPEMAAASESEVQQPPSEPAKEVRAAPEPSLAVPGSFKTTARGCEVFNEPSDSAVVLNSISPGRRLWTEDVDGNFVRVYRRDGRGYLKAECFTEPVVSAPTAEPQAVAIVETEKSGQKVMRRDEAAQSEQQVAEVAAEGSEQQAAAKVDAENSESHSVARPAGHHNGTVEAKKSEPPAEAETPSGQQPAAAATVAVEEPPPPPPPPQENSSELEKYEQVASEVMPPPQAPVPQVPMPADFSSIVTGGVAGAFLFALFYFLSRRRRVVDQTRTLTAF